MRREIADLQGRATHEPYVSGAADRNVRDIENVGSSL